MCIQTRGSAHYIDYFIIIPFNKVSGFRVMRVWCAKNKMIAYGPMRVIGSLFLDLEMEHTYGRITPLFTTCDYDVQEAN